MMNQSNISNNELISYNVGDHALLMLLAVGTFLENFIILTAIITSRKLRKEIVFAFVMSLLFAQILVSAVVLPMYSFARMHVSFGYIIAFVIIAYILNLCCITYERYIAVHQPYSYPKKICYSKTIKLICFSWFLSVLTQVLPVFWEHSIYAKLIQRVYIGFILVIFLIMPLILVWYAYIVICLELRRLNNNTKRFKPKPPTLLYEPTSPGDKVDILVAASTSNKRKCEVLSAKLIQLRKDIHLAVVLAVAAITSSITWIPVIIMNTADVLDCVELLPSNISEVSIFLLGANSFLDPIIYGLCLKETRKRLKEFLLNNCWEKAKRLKPY